MYQTKETTLSIYEQYKNLYDTLQIELYPPKNILQKLNESIRYAMRNSQFYRQQNNLCELKHIEDINKLPFTTREDLKNCQPFDFLATPMDDVIRYGRSTGTSQRYSSGYVTIEDWTENCATLYYGFSQVIDKSDIVMVAAPYELSFVAADFDRVLETIGATTIGVSSSHSMEEWVRILKIMHEVKVSVLCCSATRILRLGLLAKELGYDLFEDFHLKKVICVGELLPPQKKQIIEEIWNCSVFITYGMTEATSVASPCINHKLHLCENRYYFEIVHPDTGENVKEGEIGELVITSYHNHAMPLIRFRTGDRVKSVACGKCFLGFHAIEHFGRLDDYYFINGKKIYFYDLEETALMSTDIVPIFKFRCMDNKLSIQVLQKKEYSFDHVKERLEHLFSNYLEIQICVEQLNEKTFMKEIDKKTKPGSVYFERG